MNKQETAALFGLIATLFPRDDKFCKVDRQMVIAWAEMLADIPFDHAKAAINRGDTRLRHQANRQAPDDRRGGMGAGLRRDPAVWHPDRAQRGRGGEAAGVHRRDGGVPGISGREAATVPSPV